MLASRSTSLAFAAALLASAAGCMTDPTSEEATAQAAIEQPNGGTRTAP